MKTTIKTYKITFKPIIIDAHSEDEAMDKLSNWKYFPEIKDVEEKQ